MSMPPRLRNFSGDENLLDWVCGGGTTWERI
jgi:hypothetical protein